MIDTISLETYKVKKQWNINTYYGGWNIIVPNNKEYSGIQSSSSTLKESMVNCKTEYVT